MKGFAGAFTLISGLLYVMLATNLMLVVAALPFWAFALVGDLRVTWLWAVLTAPLLIPALAGAFAVFTAYSVEADVSPVRSFWRAWRASWRRVGGVGLACWGLLVVLGTDLYVATRWGYGALALPVCTVLAGLAVMVWVTSCVGLLARPDLPRLAVVKASLYLGVRRGGWSLVSLAVLVVLAVIVWNKPAIGLGLLAAPALYVVWGDARHVLRSLLPASADVRDEDIVPAGQGA
ncbi:MAG: DUF624 domain-containing protein [Propionibacteriaceae bacterium]|nr:DUF624 domain-containing protein [Propionibacteriaceae bacterium]